MLNNNVRHIRLTYVIDPNTISFLDIQSFIVGKRITTCTYRKPTATNILLLAFSHHPEHLIRGIPVGQFLQLHWNCSRDDDFHNEAVEMSRRSRDRSNKVLKKAWTKDRSDLLIKKQGTPM